VIGSVVRARSCGLRSSAVGAVAPADGRLVGLPTITTGISLAGRGPGIATGARLVATGIISYIPELTRYGPYAFQILSDGNRVGAGPARARLPYGG
jgi:hypothetical protein